MANVRDSDTSLWLHNKLGTSNDSWTGGSICSQLNTEVLRNIKYCFPELQTQVKLKLLLSFFHIPRKNIPSLCPELDEILDCALTDPEQWVSMLAELMKSFPSSGSLNTEMTEMEDNRRIFMDLVTDLQELVKKQTDTGMLPLECHYLNKNVLHSYIGNLPPLTKHFQQRRKPKYLSLRMELLQKSSDAASNVKKTTAVTIPLRSRGMPRKLTDTTPLKGIPSRMPSSGFRTPGTATASRPGIVRPPAGRKDGGIKFLEITEQPLGFVAAKKRKRQQELEEANKKVAAAEAEKAASATPDYAAGLVPSNPATPAPVTAPATPAPAAAAAAAAAAATPVPSTPVAPATALPPAESLVLASPATPKASGNFVISTPVSVLSRQALVLTPAAPSTPVSTKTAVARVTTTVAVTPTTHVIQVTQPAAVQQVATVRPVVVAPQPAAATAATAATAAASTVVTVQPTPVATKVVTAPVTAVTIPAKKGLSLTREQMLEAQSMFKTANKITRAEKALILGFMAGSRDNPCPHLGSIITIKLSENQEEVLQNDTYVTMVAETHFQMNYNTGEWKRMKKFRKLDEIPNTQIVVTQPPTASAQVPV
ncbi:negative elongation factor A-like [Cloeon dipterum]|uniref:negative elongation factor A-like n=1 Tax=Cloeon dipterum TaxID=197152 RepID=UPI00321FE2BC